MKAKLIMLITGFLFSYGSQNLIQGQRDYCLQEPDITGTWHLCISHEYGVDQHSNHCPEVTFYKNGKGVFFASEPSSSFNWKFSGHKIVFSFNTARDKELFMSKDSKFGYEINNSDNGSRILKLINEDIDAWYLLSERKRD